MRTESARPPIHKLNDAVALPEFMGLYDSSGRRIDEAAHQILPKKTLEERKLQVFRRLPPQIDLPADLDVIEEPVLFCGCLYQHYGHFLIDSMSRLWARDLFPSLPMLFTKDPGWKRHPAHSSEILTALGVFDRILSVKKPTIFREVICPGTSFQYRSKVFSVADEPHKEVAGALDKGDGTRWSRPVYLTRSGLSDGLRKSEAEPELEEELSKRGYEVVRPETLPFAEQISLFENAPVIAGITGSALHTALFSRRAGSKMAILNPGRGLENYLLIDALKQNETQYLKSIQRRSEQGEHILDVGLTLQMLNDAGLLAAR